MNGRAIRPLWRRDARNLVSALVMLALAALGACAPAEPPAPPAPPPAPPEAAPPPPAPPPPAPALLDSHGRMIVEAMEYPWSALGRLNSGGRGFCTGILIGPRLVLSRARCLRNRVEGRWWAPVDVHFVAGYQRDAFILHSRAASFEMAPGSSGGTSLAEVAGAGEWALVTLEAPIGLQAGWLALQPFDPGTRARLTLGEGLAVQAGYRRDWQHSVTVKLGCIDRLRVAGQDGPCASAPANPELPVILFLDGKARALANPRLLARAEAGGIAAPEFKALARRGSTWGESRAPSGGGPAGSVPTDTVVRLLLDLGYLDNDGPRDGEVRKAAIRNAERDHGLPQTGRSSVALLGKLLATARRNFLPPPRVSMVGGGSLGY